MGRFEPPLICQNAGGGASLDRSSVLRKDCRARNLARLSIYFVSSQPCLVLLFKK